MANKKSIETKTTSKKTSNKKSTQVKKATPKVETKEVKKQGKKINFLALASVLFLLSAVLHYVTEDNTMAFVYFCLALLYFCLSVSKK